MTVIVPSNIGFCKVRGQLTYVDYQQGDADGKPNLVAFSNKWIKFTPVPSKLTDLTNTPRPLSIKTESVTLYTNDDGVIVGDPIPTNLYGWVIAGDDSDLNPHGWDYKVEFQDEIFPTVFGLFPVNGDIDVASLINTVGQTGELIGPAQAAATAAASSASAAAASAASINRGVANGVAALNASGNVVNAAGVEVLPSGGGGGLGSVTLTGTPTSGQVPKASDGTHAAWSTLAKGDVGLNNVDNTTDALKPISTAQAAVNSSVASAATTLGGTVAGHTASISDLNGAVNTLNTTKATDSGLVHNTGNETIGGNKTATGAWTFQGAVTFVDASIAIADVSGLTAALSTAGLGNMVGIDGYSTARNHPVSGAALPAYPACMVFWHTVNAPGRPPAALSTDIVVNEVT